MKYSGGMQRKLNKDSSMFSGIRYFRWLSKVVKFHGSQRCLDPSSHSKTKHKSKKLTVEKLSKSGLRKCTKFDQVHAMLLLTSCEVQYSDRSFDVRTE